VAGITLAQAEAKLQEYLDAETAILTGQEYRIGSRWLTRADLSSVQEGISIWNARVQNLTRSGGIRITGATPI
jgi:hypothetical protein